jgi:hypothetical protein
MAGACALLVALVWKAMAVLGDGFWCLAAGDWVLAHGKLPDRDPFAFASVSSPWILHMPAFQIGGAWLVAHAGLTAFMAACTVPIALGAILLWLVGARGDAARAATFPLVVLLVVVDAADISARGQAFGDLALAVLLCLLFLLRDGRRVRWFWPLLLGALWANLHPSFLLAVALPLAFAAAHALDPKGERPPLAPFLRFAGLSLAGACLNPYSVVLVLDVVKLAADPTTAHVDLFQSPPFHEPLWLVPPAIAAALLVRPARRADAALIVLFTAAACMARRYGTMLVAFEVLLVGRALPVRSLARPWMAHAAGALALVAAALMLRERKDPLRDVPAAAAAVIVARALPERVMNPYHWGGYLDYAWRGERKAFIDGRNQLFSNGAFTDATTLWSLAPGWEDVLDVYEVGTVLWESGAPLDRALQFDARFREVYRDRIAVIYVRR